MLRGLMLDNRTMKEDKFRETMRDFYQTYAGGEAGTEDFRKIVEKHVGVDMSWFFDEWVYGTAVPSYTFSYKIEEAPEGKYQITVRVEQKDVPDGFTMYVPLKVDFGEKGSVRDRILVNQPHVELKLPLMPYKPEEVIFNDLDAVLCQVEEVPWH
jgi:aminopeptidase N